ncbi:cellulase family glycosylhydrolase [Mucilaginibacter gossypiicola]|nr:cellulase family glycosylhydrolase [Mucilaginibacter gossypiicola]
MPAQLSLGNITDTIPEAGGTIALKFSTNASWSVDTSGIGWLHLNQTSGNSGDVVVNLTAAANSSGMSRSVLLNLSSGNGQNRRISVIQNAKIYPSYNISPKPADASGMSSTVTQLAANIKMGYNIYNTMEAPGSETGWGNPAISQQLIDLVKNSGMNAVRIPVQYDMSHIIDRSKAKIDPAWLNRLKEVVQYCINDNVYAMVDIHWDGGWLDCTATGAKQDSINAKQKAYWEQIATTLRDFDEHLLFASANEPNATDIPTATVLMRYHQTFINAVRSTGGRNTYRTLVIQSPSTSIDLANQYLKASNVYKVVQLPVDPTPNKMILEFHYYTPSNFCILSADASWGKENYFWGASLHTKNPLFLDRNSAASTEEHYVDSIFHTAKVNFVDQGIPVIMGEFGTEYHADKLKGFPVDSLLSVNSQMHYYRYVTQQAKTNGVLPFLWASDVFNRQTNKIGNQRTLDSLKRGGGF